MAVGGRYLVSYKKTVPKSPLKCANEDYFTLYDTIKHVDERLPDLNSLLDQKEGSETDFLTLYKKHETTKVVPVAVFAKCSLNGNIVALSNPTPQSLVENGENFKTLCFPANTFHVPRAPLNNTIIVNSKCGVTSEAKPSDEKYKTILPANSDFYIKAEPPDVNPTEHLQTETLAARKRKLDLSEIQFDSTVNKQIKAGPSYFIENNATKEKGRPTLIYEHQIDLAW